MVDKKVYNRKELDEIAQIQSNEEPVRLYEEDIDRHRQAIADSKDWYNDDDDQVNIPITEHNKAVLREVERLKKIWGRN